MHFLYDMITQINQITSKKTLHNFALWKRRENGKAKVIPIADPSTICFWPHVRKGRDEGPFFISNKHRRWKRTGCWFLFPTKFWLRHTFIFFKNIYISSMPLHPRMGPFVFHSLSLSLFLSPFVFVFTWDDWPKARHPHLCHLILLSTFRKQRLNENNLHHKKTRRSLWNFNNGNDRKRKAYLCFTISNAWCEF